MKSIILLYDPNHYWEDFMLLYNIRHDNVINDKEKFILYYFDEYHLLKLGFEFGQFYSLKIAKNEPNVQ